MELEIEKPEHQGNLELGGYDFNVDEEDLDVLILASRDKIYSSPIKTMVQEYVNNAKDACIEAGKFGNEIDIWWPTHLDANFHIRDYGIGISPEDMPNVYIKIGKSTKRSNQNAIGKYGLGSKIGFVYADAFMICSYYNGVKYSYWAHKGENQKGKLKPLGEEPTEEPNGIELTIPINRTQDIDTFRSAIIRAVGLWEKLPNIKNIEEGKYTDILENRYESCTDRFIVPHRFFLDRFDTLILDNGTPYPTRFDTRFHQVAYISKGNEVEIPASREEVLDNHKLEKFLEDRKKDEEEFYSSIIADIEDHSTFGEFDEKFNKWKKVIKLNFDDLSFEEPHPLAPYYRTNHNTAGTYQNNKRCNYTIWKVPSGRVLPVEVGNGSFNEHDFYHHPVNEPFPYSSRGLRDIFQYHDFEKLPVLLTTDPDIINYFKAKPVTSLEVPKKEKAKVRASRGYSSPVNPNSVCVRSISNRYITIHKCEERSKEIYYYNCKGLTVVDESFDKRLVDYMLDKGKRVYGLPKRAQELLPKWGYTLKHISEFNDFSFNASWKWRILANFVDEKWPTSFSRFVRLVREKDIKITDPFLRKAIEYETHNGIAAGVKNMHLKEIEFLKAYYCKKAEQIIQNNCALVGFSCLENRTRNKKLLECYQNSLLNT